MTVYNDVNKPGGLTSADLGADSLSQSAALGQLLPEALAHVVVDVVGPQQLLEGLGGVAQVLGEDVAHPPALPLPLAEVRQLSGLSLDERVEFTAERETEIKVRIFYRDNDFRSAWESSKKTLLTCAELALETS